MKSFFALALAVALGAAPALLPAARVTLISGEVLEGEILEESPTAIKIRTVRTAVSIPRARIKSVEQSEPGSLALLEAREFLSRGDLPRAEASLKSAVAAGASGPAVDELKETIRKEMSRAELARYAALLEEAKKAAARGETHSALQEIRTLLEGMPKDSPARPELIDIISSYHQARANDLRDKVRHQEAAAELAKVIELDPNRAEAYLSLGDLYRGSSAAWDRAVESYQKALVLGKDSLHAEDVTRAHWEIGEIRRQQKRWKDSAMAYREVWLRDKAFNLRLGERLVETIKEFAQEMRGSKPEAALAAVEEGIRVRATEADLHVTRGELLASLNRPDEATKAFEEALRLNPRLRGVHYAIALNFEKNGETLVAREWLEKEITGNPGHYDSLLKLGQLALERDDFGAAELFFTRARNVDPDLPQAPLGLSRVYRRQKEQQKARDMANEVLVRFPEDRYAHLEMGKILLDESNLEQARQYFSSVLDLVDKARLDPEASDRLNKAELDRLAADALLARGAVGLLTAGPGTANADFRKALEVVPDYPEAYFAIGAAYRKKFASSKRLEDLKEAETNMLKARELTPKNAQYALELGILYSQELAQSDKDNEKAHRERAVEHWRDYIKLGGANVGQVEAWIREISG